MNTVFSDFRKKFRHFFDLCEQGFANELIINLYARIYTGEYKLIGYKEKFNELYFIQEGEVLMYNKFGYRSFMKLP